MILSSQYLQVLVLILFTISTCQSSDISNEIVRQGVGSFGTELILEEMSQVWLNVDIVLITFSCLDCKCSYVNFKRFYLTWFLWMWILSVQTQDRRLWYFGIKINLNWILLEGSLSSGAYDNSSCVWLLHTEEAEAQVNIICDNIRLPSCKVTSCDHLMTVYVNIFLQRAMMVRENFQN